MAAFAQVWSLLFFLPSAFADMDIPIKKITAYSGGDGEKKCPYDPNGGGAKGISRLGVKVRDHTVDGPRKDGFAAAAVPRGGSNMSGILGCTFTEQNFYPGVTFRAVDTYGEGSNGMEKFDASHDCKPGLNSKTKEGSTKIIVAGNCGGEKGEKDYKKVQRRKPSSR